MSVSLGDRSFSASALFELSQLTSLKSLEIGSNCLSSIDSFSLDGLNNLTAVSIGDGSLANSTSFNLSNLKSLEILSIGNECFDLVDVFNLEGLNALKTLKVGQNSFTLSQNDFGDNKNRSFHITNCNSIKSIDIGKYSFSDYAGEFELKNLESLESIQIGTINESSLNFHDSLFSVQGRELSSLIRNRSCEIEFHFVGRWIICELHFIQPFEFGITQIARGWKRML